MKNEITEKKKRNGNGSSFPSILKNQGKYGAWHSLVTYYIALYHYFYLFGNPSKNQFYF